MRFERPGGMTMTCIVFPHCEWALFPYRQAVSRLGDTLGPLMIAAEEAEDPLVCADPRLFSLEACAAWEERPSLVLVTHPYWIEHATALRPDRLMMLLPEDSFESDTAYWNDRLRQAAGIADLFACESESKYLEMAFMKENVLLLFPTPGMRNHPESLLAQAMNGRPAAEIAAEQQEDLAGYYASLRDRTGPHETISFLLAVYEYLLERPSAAAHLTESFVQAVLHERHGCLISHYRFSSAIKAREDDLLEASAVYGTTALTTRDQAKYESICRWLEEGRPEMAKAELFSCNDDLFSAIACLSDEKSEDALRLQVSLLKDSGRLPEAIGFLEQLAVSRSDAIGLLLLQGDLRKLLGHSREAVQLYLKAAELDPIAMAAIARFKSDRQAVDRLLSAIRNRPAQEEGGRQDDGFANRPSGA
jgi:tetratricopeptide (TPR) repeat protein